MSEPNNVVRHLRLCGVFGVVLLAATTVEAQKAVARAGASDTFPPGYSASVTGGIHDFDFYFGAWTVRSRGLKARNIGSKNWKEFSSVTCVTSYLNGGANVSEMLFAGIGQFRSEKTAMVDSLHQRQDRPIGSGNGRRL